jgi:hypothetical protein
MNAIKFNLKLQRDFATQLLRDCVYFLEVLELEKEPPILEPGPETAVRVNRQVFGN